MRNYMFAVGRVEMVATCVACGDPCKPHVCVNLGELTLLRLCLGCAAELGGDVDEVVADAPPARLTVVVYQVKIDAGGARDVLYVNKTPAAAGSDPAIEDCSVRLPEGIYFFRVRARAVENGSPKK